MSSKIPDKVPTYFFSLTSGLEMKIGKLLSEKQELLLKNTTFQSYGMAIIKSLETMIKSENIVKSQINNKQTRPI